MKKRADKNLAEGEATGHAHVATAEDCEVFGDGDERLLIVSSGTKIVHEEHGAITLPAGRMRVTRQREIDPDTDDVHAVDD